MCGESKTRSAGAGCSQVIEKARFVRTLYRNIDVMPRILFESVCEDLGRLHGDKQAQREEDAPVGKPSAVLAKATSVLEQARRSSLTQHIGMQGRVCCLPAFRLARVDRLPVAPFFDEVRVPDRELACQRFGVVSKRKASSLT